ncbi:toxin, partial [Mammaliicoccus fleurettii]|nr:toxin [Mammaliicoccus fleurettii]
MNRYEKTLINNEHIVIKETNNLPHQLKGLYVDGLILLKDDLSNKEKLEVLGEELAHHDITYGDILDTNELWKWKFEHKARRLGFEKIIPLKSIVQAYQSG